ncbi:DALR anticodon-binding domain-containing protein 3 isoform X12 [Orcinus orca]|uniref:DALR anticodon-binding domain-containing protein 3 isoform X12 n=1 Tax=Orcinus orca TaxID=9733 RepID=UPI001441FB88|nr:DALR anticodon-binding domain-containing protein 3 isoform X12 [Orcinus orca]XP_033269025.1 DALR anticodon-binding domain-containing protein 3 isoform X12 [Orcinus orca]
MRPTGLILPRGSNPDRDLVPGKAPTTHIVWGPRCALRLEVTGVDVGEPRRWPSLEPEVPERVVHAIVGLQGPGVAPVLSCAPTPAGLTLQLRRSAVFERVLGAVAAYAAPTVPAAPGPRVVLHCPALRGSPCALRLSQLRAVLVADHLARALHAHRVSVRLVPAVRDPHMPTFLQQLRVDWPAASERAATEALRSRALAELTPARNAEALPPGALGRVYLKELVDERGRTTGYDPKLDSCLGRTRSLAGPESSWAPHSPPASALCVLFAVTEDLLAVLAELQQAVQDWAEDSSLGLAAAPDAGADSCMVVHVVSCEEEFQQQKLDLLWWKLDDQAPLRQAPACPGVQGLSTEARQGPGTRCAWETLAVLWTQPGWKSSGFSLWQPLSLRCSAQPHKVSFSWPWPTAAFPQRAPKVAPLSCIIVHVLPHSLRVTSAAWNKVCTPLSHL